MTWQPQRVIRERKRARVQLALAVFVIAVISACYGVASREIVETPALRTEEARESATLAQALFAEAHYRAREVNLEGR